MERSIFGALKKGKKVEVDITLKYKDRSARPDFLEVKYKINGKPNQKIIPNPGKGN
jgi:hypothetical protein